MKQTGARLIRTDQEEEVLFFLVKVKNTYHDHIEKICLTRWANQLSAEIGLPTWMSGAVREIVIWETIKSHWHTPFNRYAWNIQRDLNGEGFEYHSSETVALGHMMSILARLIIHTHAEQQHQMFWGALSAYIVPAAQRLMSETQDDDESLLDWLRESDSKIKRYFFVPLQNHVEGILEEEESPNRENVNDIDEEEEVSEDNGRGFDTARLQMGFLLAGVADREGLQRGMLEDDEHKDNQPQLDDDETIFFDAEEELPSNDDDPYTGARTFNSALAHINGFAGNSQREYEENPQTNEIEDSETDNRPDHRIKRQRTAAHTALGIFGAL